MRFLTIIMFMGASILAGCDNGTVENPLPNNFAIIKALVSQSDVPLDPRTTLTVEQIEAVEVPILLIHAMDTTGIYILMDRVTTGRFTRWGELGGGEVIFDRNLPFRTHAFGADLLSVEASGTIAALTKREPATVTRMQTFLDSENQEVTIRFNCSVQSVGETSIHSLGRNIPTFLMREHCMSEDHDVTNSYWINRKGNMARQRVWINPRIGRLEFEFLSDQ
ncbi:MAG: YjbF family lipoprotein [Pseudomonadota bacterium]